MEDHDDDDEPVMEIELPGFDPFGEPVLYIMPDDSMKLCIQFMPPSWAPEKERDELGHWTDFDVQIADAIGTPVYWEDREWFLIEKPRPDTRERIKHFLQEIRQQYDNPPAPN